MPLLIECTHCRQPYRVPETAIGRRTKCTKCGQEFAIATPSANGAPAVRVEAAKSAVKPVTSQPVPDATATSSKPRGPLTQQELLAAFHEPFPRSRPKFTYHLGILLTGFTMVILPLIYLAFIALLGFGVYLHAAQNAPMLQMGEGRARGVSIALYLAPLVSGAIAIFFMLKPLLARPSRRERSRSLTRQGEPLLFAFVDRICEEVGAPQPNRIDVDCNVNAAASFRRGIWSMVGSDMVLTIGLPLAAGLSLQEFGGVLAHEFGHFSQGVGMRVSYFVRAIVHWFIRVVYQRDQWDDWLAQISTGLDIRIGWIFLVAQLFVLIGRGLLWILLHIGLAISGIMLRQMEYDADRYEARFAGSKTFGITAKKLHVLNFAFAIAQKQLSASLDSRKLVNDLPALIVYHARQSGRAALPEIEKTISDAVTRWYDSHPCDRARIIAAERLATPGIFHSDRLASELFSDFAAQSAATTWDLYIGVFGPKVPRTALQPLPQFVAEHSQPVPATRRF